MVVVTHRVCEAIILADMDAKALQESLIQAHRNHQQGHLQMAESAYRAILTEVPAHPQTLHLLGACLLQDQRPAEALQVNDQALARLGPSALFLSQRAAALLALKRYSEAVQAAESACQQDANAFAAWMNLGLAHSAQGAWSPAHQAFVNALAIHPQDIRCQTEWRAAALRADPPSFRPVPPEVLDRAAEVLDALAAIVSGLVPLERITEARELAAAVARRLREQPRHRLRWVRMVDRAGLPLSAIELAGELVRQHRSMTEAWLYLGHSQLSLGLPGESGSAYRELLKLQPDHWQAHSNALISEQHDPTASADQIAQSHRAWARTHAPAPRALPARSGRTGAIRIGWFSPRLLAGPTDRFFSAVLAAFPRRQAEHWLFHTERACDQRTEAFIQAADHYIDAADCSDQQLVERARAERLDLAVDLVGHGPGHRLRAFSTGLAPMQLSWLDYFHPTTLASLPYFLGDAVLNAGQSERFPEHRLLTLPSGRLCYTPPENSPVAQRRDDDRLRFGCFNRLAKINHRVLETWANLLADLPRAELELRAGAFDRAEVGDWFRRRLERFGIPAERVALKGWQSLERVLKAYQRIDIALDPFPFSGCATSADALWMGVPVITMPGETMVSRQSASWLEQVGLHDWIARTPNDYCTIGRRAAVEIDRLRAGREDLRRRFTQACGQPAIFAEDLERRLVDLGQRGRV